MKEKIILKSNWATKHTEAPYWSFELPLSELISQLREQGYEIKEERRGNKYITTITHLDKEACGFCGQKWDNHDYKKCSNKPPQSCPTDLECPFCECEDKYQQVYNSLFNKGELVCAKCHKPIKPTQKPKIEELEESEMSITDTVDKAEKMILTQKLNEVISAVNELYER